MNYKAPSHPSSGLSPIGLGLTFSGSPKYRDFLRAFWHLSEQDGYPVVLREFQQVISLIQGNQRMTQNELNRPFSILSVDCRATSPPSTLSSCR